MRRADPGQALSARRRRGWALFGVAALHVLLFGLLSRPGTPRIASTVPASVSMRLFPWVDRAPERAAPPESVEPRRPRPSAAIGERIVPRTRPSAAAPPGAAATPEPMAAAPAAEPVPLPEPAASQPPRSLDLTLPRGFSLRPDTRNPAVDDPLANRERLTPEQRMARAFDQRVIEERLGDGSVRLRQGANCVILAPARASQLFPSDPSAANAPRTVQGC